MLNNHYMARARGFTLVELLVAISIIAILSVTAMVIYGQVTMNARDARRKLDLQNIAQALEIYYQKNGRYPATEGLVYSYNGTSWIPGLAPDYINSLPVDPKRNDWMMLNPDQYGYGYCSGSGCGECVSNQWYILAAKLENHNDPDINGSESSRKYKWCDGRPITAFSPYNMYLTPNQ